MAVISKTFDEKADALLYGMSKGVAAHSRAVAAKAFEIAKRIQANGHAVDAEVARLGGLLHDTGRTNNPSANHGIDTGRILRKEGFPEKIVHVGEMHSYPGKTLADMSLEAKIVKYVDGRMKHAEWVSLDERRRDVVERRMKEGLSNVAKEIMAMKPFHEELEKEIVRLAGCKSPEEL